MIFFHVKITMSSAPASQIISANRVDKRYPVPLLSQQRYQGERIFFKDYFKHMSSTEEKAPLEYDKFCKAISPIFTHGNLLVAPENIEHLGKSLMAIAKFTEMAPESRHEFKSIDDWNNGVFTFSVRRFGYMPNRPDHSLMEAAEIYFSPSKVYQCFSIKAELMITAYWRFKDEPYWGPIIRAIITYAVDMYNAHNGSDEYKAARYLFELALAYNFFVAVYDESKVGIPAASTPAQTFRYSKIQEFGCYRVHAGTTCKPDDPNFFLYSCPRTSTDIPFDMKTMFYIPYADEVADKSMFCFKNALQKAITCPDMNHFLMQLTKMFAYTADYLVSAGKPAQPQYPSFKSVDEAQKYIDEKIPIDRFIKGVVIYYCLKVDMGENNYKAVVLQRTPAQGCDSEPVKVCDSEPAKDSVESSQSSVETKSEDTQ